MARSRVTIALALASLAAAAGNANAQPSGRAPGVGDKLPDIVVPRANGKEPLRLLDAGPRVVLTFFAAFCRPCYLELPIVHRVVAAANKRLGKKKRVHLVIIVADKLPPASWRKKLVGKATWLLDGSGLAGQTFRVNNYPSTFFVVKGRIRAASRRFTRGFSARATAWANKLFR